MWQAPRQGWLFWGFWCLVGLSVAAGLLARLAGCQAAC